MENETPTSEQLIDRIISDCDGVRKYKYIGSYHIYNTLEKSIKYLSDNVPDSVGFNKKFYLDLLSADCRDIFKVEYEHWAKLRKEPNEFRTAISKAIGYYENLARAIDETIYSEKSHLF